MIKYISKFILLVLTGTIPLWTYSDIAFSGSSISSLTISSKQNDSAYYVTIRISGIEASEVITRIKKEKLYVTARNGINVTSNAISGGQFVNYSYKFAKDADLENLTRVNSSQQITITIPKVHKIQK